MSQIRGMCSLRKTPALFVVTALGLAALTAPLAAQGTPEQREACAPDAIKLCSDTIPDVARTTACMSRHRSSLSPHCAAVFAAATGTAPAPSHHPRTVPTHTAHAPAVAARAPAVVATRRDRPVHVGAIEPRAPRHHTLETSQDRDIRDARRVFGNLCASQVLSPDTCGFAQQMITLAQQRRHS